MLGLKIKGQNYNSFLMQIAASNGTATNNYNFLGDIKLNMLGSKSTFFIARIM
jgi:hypothetical protein